MNPLRETFGYFALQETGSSLGQCSVYKREGKLQPWRELNVSFMLMLE
jgi:hypothetical protein